MNMPSQVVVDDGELTMHVTRSGGSSVKAITHQNSGCLIPVLISMARDTGPCGTPSLAAY